VAGCCQSLLSNQDEDSAPVSSVLDLHARSSVLFQQKTAHNQGRRKTDTVH
jgi:hypothetical protein